MAKQKMSKTYDPKTTEGRLYEFWESRGYFTPQVDTERRPFVISMPPSNITGELHIGHALTMTVQDIMIRWHRMQGEPTLWLPGSDHASIATHNVIERGLEKRELDDLLRGIGYPVPSDGRSLARHDLSREWFVKLGWAWKERYGGYINQQLRRLGASCDWTRERFTMDEGLSRAVRMAFVRLYEKGLIYRGKYLVNWCPRCGTAISDLEVEHEEGRGKLYWVRYPLAVRKGSRGKGGYIEVATTRPETILGDTAVAVNPDDERYKGLVGKMAILPVLGRRIPIIADRAVDMEFGTGAVKVTPGHDPHDYEISQRHNLPIVNAMNPDGTMSEEAGPYAGLDRYEARERLLADLDKEGLLIKVEDHLHAPGRCQRCQSMIEPLISEQWFIKIKPLAERALDAVREGRIEIIPERFTKVYYNWLENIRDWCISRQLWWGHRIPVWYCNDCQEVIVSIDEPRQCTSCKGANLRQDPDILDTWFSSALWPFSTLGWPDDTEDLRHFYPTTVMETAYDILFFWVARMIMMGLECGGDIPFHIVYLHGLVRDEHGEKMSRSKGNVIDPLEVMDEYGTDALRFTLMTGSTPGNDMRLSLQQVEASRNFANKIWNAARFVTSNLPEGYDLPDLNPWERDLTPPDRWILSRHNRLIGEVNRLTEGYQFGEAGRQIHEFLWGEYCDWYIEASKVALYGDDEKEKERTRHVLVYVLERTLRLLHPFMPFVTEEIWQHLPHEGESLIIAPWPEAGPVDEEVERAQETLWEHIRAIRNWKAEERLEPGVLPVAHTETGDVHELFMGERATFERLAGVKEQDWVMSLAKPLEGIPIVTGTFYTSLDTEEIDREEKRERLSKQILRLDGEIARARALLNNENFRAKAPLDVQEREREKLARFEEERARLLEKLEELS
ncbi:MAG: valine--tRNA ligase [Anaerolineae bacterium]